jgi:flavodoxin
MDAPCQVLYSTQSGRAKACARRVVRIIREQYDMTIRSVSSFDESPNNLLLLPPSTESETKSCLWILLVSTTGDGEHCDSIQSTWKAL